VLGAQLAIGNTSFHKLFSVPRDPYNVGRGSGLRILVDTRDGRRLLTPRRAACLNPTPMDPEYRLLVQTVAGGSVARTAVKSFASRAPIHVLSDQSN
jgi:hypothetical protein